MPGLDWSGFGNSCEVSGLRVDALKNKGTKMNTSWGCREHPDALKQRKFQQWHTGDGWNAVGAAKFSLERCLSLAVICEEVVRESKTLRGGGGLEYSTRLEGGVAGGGSLRLDTCVSSANV